MQILKPLGNLKAEKVKNWSEIKQEAHELRQMMEEKNYDGNWRDAYAISHVQVSNSPKDFFVVNKSKKGIFRHWCVINLRILKMEEEGTFPEGCMSFMFRDVKKVKRFGKIKVKYWTPLFNLFLIPHWRTFKDLDACVCQHEFDHANGVNIYGI